MSDKIKELLDRIDSALEFFTTLDRTEDMTYKTLVNCKSTIQSLQEVQKIFVKKWSDEEDKNITLQQQNDKMREALIKTQLFLTWLDRPYAGNARVAYEKLRGMQKLPLLNMVNKALNHH